MTRVVGPRTLRCRVGDHPWHLWAVFTDHHRAARPDDVRSDGFTDVGWYFRTRPPKVGWSNAPAPLVGRYVNHGASPREHPIAGWHTIPANHQSRPPSVFRFRGPRRPTPGAPEPGDTNHQSSPRSAKLRHPAPATTRWSSTRMSTSCSASFSLRVITSSAGLGSATPLG